MVRKSRLTEKKKIERNGVDMGFGMFIHWSVDVQLGAIISHNAAVGSKYVEKPSNMKKII